MDESTPRENLRRSVRRAVHRACWQRLESEAPEAHEHFENELAAALAANDGAAAAEPASVQQWIREDEAEFERAVLISDLVARRIASRVPASTLPSPAPANTAPLAAPPPRRPVRQAPGIADLLDDMFAQQADATR